MDETSHTKATQRARKKSPHDQNEKQCYGRWDIKTSHLFSPMKKLFIIRDIGEGTYGSLITGNNMTSHRMGLSIKLNSGLKMKLNGTFKRTRDMYISFSRCIAHSLARSLTCSSTKWHWKHQAEKHIGTEKRRGREKERHMQCFDLTVNRAPMHANDMNNAC